MNDEEKLAILKADLQLLTSAHDSYLMKLLELGAAQIKREGIRLEDSVECDMAVVHYAAYLFRKRASDNTVMPRFLRYELNNLLFGQKGNENGKNDIR